MNFQYSDYCTAYYVPSYKAVCIYDEIADDEIQRINAADAFHAERIIDAWSNIAPAGIIAERL